ncbi:MAG: helix-turn-helix domain-containing protein [Candidatus Alcyoniella australis]|nr:helix-turn-helix domain-containing protein [Candidatus Alcyoniella australis]
MPADDRWFSVDEIAEHFGVSKDTVYAWLTAKGMPGHRVGRFWKFKKDEVDEWIRAGGAAASTTENDSPPGGEHGAGVRKTQ